MSQPLQLLNFCKSGLKKVDKAFAPAAPLDTVSLLGLNSFGCQPLLSHRGDTGQHILSQVKQTNGAVVQQLLTTENDGGIIGGGPPAQEDLPYGGMIAGLRGANPVTGSATSPFPTTIATTDLLWTVGSRKWAHTINGISQDLSGDSNALKLLEMRGLGGQLDSGSGAGTLVQLPPDSREYSGGIRLRANHSYVSTMTLPYSPQLEPLIYIYNTTYGYYIEPGYFGGAPVVIGSSGGVDISGYGVSVAPCLVSTNGDLITSTSALYPNGPDLHRQFSLYRLGSFTMPGVGQSYSSTWDTPSANLRAFLCVYVDSHRIDNVSCHEGSTVSATSVTLPVPGNGPPSIFTPAFPGIAFDTVYQFAVSGNESGYTFDVTSGSTTVTTATVSFSLVVTSQYQFYEAYLDAA